MTAVQREVRDNSGKLFDHLMQAFDLKTDAALARFLGVAPPIVSKVRHGWHPVGATMIINVHEKSDMSIATIKALIAG